MRPRPLHLVATLVAVLCAAPAVAHGAVGELEPTFGADGRVLVGSEEHATWSARDVARLADGRLVVAGCAFWWQQLEDGNTEYRNAFALARLTAGGDLDPTFADGGLVRSEWGEPTINFGGNACATDVVALPGGGVLAAGYTESRLAMIRYRPDGSEDAAFGDGGRVLFAPEDLNLDSYGSAAMTVLDDGRIVLAGIARPPASGDVGFVIARFNADGSLDPTFAPGSASGHPGVQYTPVHIGSFNVKPAVGELLELSDGDLLLAGGPQPYPRPDFSFPMPSDGIMLARYDADGTPAAGYGDGGVANRPLGGYASALGAAEQPDGKVVVAAHTRGDGFTVARLTDSGELDPSFGGVGWVSRAVPGGDGAADAVAVDSAGRIVAAGRGSTADGDGFVAARFLPDGAPDAAFGSGGVAPPEGTLYREEMFSVLPLPDGRTLLAGSRFDEAFDVMRLKGPLDPDELPPPDPTPQPGPKPEFTWSVPSDLDMGGIRTDVWFDSCDDPNNTRGWTRWDFGDGTPPVEGECRVKHHYPDERPYTITVRRDYGGSAFGETTEVVRARNHLVFSIGESYAAGEGNPVRLQGPDGWSDKQCHRSTLAAPWKAAEALDAADEHSSVTIVHLACSGAKIRASARGKTDGGLLDPYDGIEHDASTPTLPPQLSQVTAWLRAHDLTGADVDALFVGIGGNDIGFSDVGATCVLNAKCWDDLARGDYSCAPDAALSCRSKRQLALRADYRDLADCIAGHCPAGEPRANNVGVRASHVFLNAYPDPTADEHGTTCDRILDASDVATAFLGTLFGPLGDYWGRKQLVVERAELEYIRARVIEPLNDLGREISERAGWSHVGGIVPDSRLHGYCAGDERWVITLRDVDEVPLGSLGPVNKKWIQRLFAGDSRYPGSGLLHPDREGHFAYAKWMFRAAWPVLYAGEPPPPFPIPH